MGTELYGYAIPTGFDTGLIRLGGAGLGNLLFSWARCAVFCKATGARQLYTTWPQLKPGSWIRWEKDKRHYWGLFRPLKDEVQGTAKLRVLCSLPRRKEHEQTGSSRGIVVFRDNRGYFLDIPAKDCQWLRERFFASLSDQQLLQSKSKPHIGVHIRKGDHPAYDSKVTSIGNMQLPMSWYAHVLKSIVAELSSAIEIGVCSDATEDELKTVLQIPNVRLVKGRTAQEDLIYLANSCLVIGSISTFSQWGAYLSGRPSIWHPKFNRRGGLGNGSYELILSQERLPSRAEWKLCLEQAFQTSEASSPQSPSRMSARTS